MSENAMAGSFVYCSKKSGTIKGIRKAETVFVKKRKVFSECGIILFISEAHDKDEKETKEKA